jgi:hypothetical protein
MLNESEMSARTTPRPWSRARASTSPEPVFVAYPYSGQERPRVAGAASVWGTTVGPPVSGGLPGFIGPSDFALARARNRSRSLAALGLRNSSPTTAPAES